LKDIPPFSRIAKGYQVLVCNSYDKTHDGQSNCWTPTMNSWGCAYAIKGFAIKKAKRYLSWYRSHTREMLVCIMEQSSGDIVWKSWEQENE
tara:strand:- start:3847 stop:4119 length:273 start_codon:yes stop_codon:yes gene_type:complete